MKPYKTVFFLLLTQILVAQYSDQKTIWAKGEVIEAYAPNKATFKCEFKEESKYPKASKQSFHSFLKEFIQKCNSTKLRGLEKDLELDSIKIRKKRTYSYQKDKPISYVITQNIIFNIDYRDAEEFINLLDSITALYNFNVEWKSEYFWSTETEQKQEELFLKAIDNAKEKAQKIAKHTNITLSTILFVRKGYSSVKFQGFKKNYSESRKIILGKKLYDSFNKLLHSYSVDVGFSIK